MNDLRLIATPKPWLLPNASVRQMLDRIDELEETVRQLQDLLRRQEGFPLGWRLSPAESRLLSLLSRRGEAGASHETAMAAVAHDPDTNGLSKNALSATVMHLRRKVKGLGIEIRSVHGSGYALAAESLPIVKAAISASRDQEK